MNDRTTVSGFISLLILLLMLGCNRPSNIVGYRGGIIPALNPADVFDAKSVVPLYPVCKVGGGRPCSIILYCPNDGRAGTYEFVNWGTNLSTEPRPKIREDGTPTPTTMDVASLILALVDHYGPDYVDFYGSPGCTPSFRMPDWTRPSSHYKQPALVGSVLQDIQRGDYSHILALPEYQEALREVFGPDLSFYNELSGTLSIEEKGRLIVASACKEDDCVERGSVFTIDMYTGQSAGALYSPDGIALYTGDYINADRLPESFYNQWSQERGQYVASHAKSYYVDVLKKMADESPVLLGTVDSIYEPFPAAAPTAPSGASSIAPAQHVDSCEIYTPWHVTINESCRQAQLTAGLTHPFVYVEPMKQGFDGFLRDAIVKQGVPVTLVDDKKSADVSLHGMTGGLSCTGDYPMDKFKQECWVWIDVSPARVEYAKWWGMNLHAQLPGSMTRSKDITDDSMEKAASQVATQLEASCERAKKAEMEIGQRDAHIQAGRLKRQQESERYKQWDKEERKHLNN